MAELLNSRNKLLNEAATRILGAAVYITSGVAASFTIPANATTTVPGNITLTAVPSRYVSPQYTWSYRFGDAGSFITIANSDSPNYEVVGDSSFLTQAAGSNIVQYKVDVVETATQGANPSSFTISLPILRQGVNSVLGVLSNESQSVYADADGVVPDGTVIESTLYIYNGTSDDSANWSASINASTGVTASLVSGKTISVQLPLNTLNGYVDITATRQGYPNVVKRFTISKVLAGQDGVIGADGNSNALVYAYKRSASAPTDNPGAVDYSFTTNSITTATLANNWQKTIPAGIDPLYVVVATASSSTGTDTIASGEWASPVLLVQNGTNGLNTATVFLYARNNSTATAPTLATTGSATYTFSTGVLSGTIPSGWTTAIPDVASGTVIWAAQATASSSTATDTIANTEWSTPRVLAQKGDTGSDGNDGVSPTSYEVSAVSPVINRSASNVLTPSSLVVNAYSTTGSAKSAYSGRFKIYEDGVLKYTSSTNQSSYTYTPVSPATVSLFKIELYLAGGTTTLLDSQEVPVTVSGSSGITISISNTAFTAPADSSGAVSTYTGSGTTIQVFEGSTALTYRTTLGTNASSFTIGTPTLSVANAITVGARSGDGTTTATVANHSAMSNSVSAVVISYPITYNRANGAQATQTVTQTITKALAGSIGVRGSRQIYDTNAAYTSTYDFDGDGAIAAGAASYAARATQLVATVTVGLNPTTPINGDTVTFTNGTDYVYTITHNGTSWNPPGTIIDGNLLVTGSVTASKINSNGLDIRDGTGNVILSAGSSLQSQIAPYEFGATRNVFRGEWSESTVYSVGDIVLESGYGWSCVQQHSSSTTIKPPVYPSTSNSYWTVYAVKGDSGLNAVTAILSNEAHVFPATSTGAVSSYTGSGTQIRVYEGATELIYDGAGTSNGTWKLTSTATNITVGTVTDSGSYATVGNHSGVSSGTDNSSITYTLTGKTASGNSFTIVKTQTFSKSKTGATGADGAAGADGAPGPQGPAVLVTTDRPATFTATDGTLDASQANIIFTASVSGITSPTYTWSFSGLQTNPTASTTSTQTITSAQFGTSKSAIVTCTVSGTYVDKVTIVRLEKSTAAAGATKNTVYRQTTEPTTGVVNGDIWVDTSVTPNVQKVRVSGSWQVASTVGASFDTTNPGKVTGQITAGNASTYIANAAIGAAQIGSISLVGTNNFNVKSATTGQRMEMDSRVIKIFDANNVLRVQLGDLTI